MVSGFSKTTKPGYIVAVKSGGDKAGLVSLCPQHLSTEGAQEQGPYGY